MPKIKTNRGAAKRLKRTAKGRIKRRRGYLRHLLSSKSRKQKRRLGKPALVDPADEKAMKRLLPYA